MPPLLSIQVPGLADANVIVQRVGTILGHDGNICDT